MYDHSLHELWDRCNGIILAWIMNTVSPNLISTVIYASNAHKMWEDLKERFDKVNASRDCYIHKEMATLTQGLNESFEHAKDQVLMTRPLPNINQAYAMIINIETLLSNKTSAGGYRQKNNSGKALVQCDYCNYKGHTRKNCFKLHGYPVGFKPKKKGGPPNTYNNTYANNVTSTGGQYSGGQHCSQPGVPSQAQFFTPEQYSQILQLLNKGNEVAPMANIAKSDTADTYSAMLSTLVDTNWIIDTSATDHMVHNMALLNKCSDLPKETRSKVLLHTGGQVSITKSGESSIFQDRTIHNVLNVPKFKYNMLYVSKITKELSCLAAFFPDFYLFQELFSGKGPYRVSTLYGKRYFLILVDDFSRYTWIFLLSTKADSIVVLKYFSVLVRNQFCCNVKCLRTDNGYEFVNTHINSLLKDFGIVHQSSCVYTPQQNGIVERRHRYILDMDRALRFQAFIPLKFWGECVSTAVYLLNRLPTALLKGKSPFEKLFLRPPSLHHLRVFGSLCYATNVRRQINSVLEHFL
ncbi:uncharacterized protein LOC107799593 [Nicotiana tabacum]|uniref:Uncharacterized protein LOC107799593 n=1 Tax=Nicotiana tabacum TaxID=4097 RepID=A0AC58RWI4_TOBAC